MNNYYIALFRLCHCLIVLLAVFALVACASSKDEEATEIQEELKVTDQQESASEHDSSQQTGTNPSDPWEKYNRRVYAFNDFLDRNLLVPLAEGYVFITPGFFRSGVSNFFSNLGEPVNFVNNILQGDIEGSITNVMRVVTNVTFGVFGLFDVATEVGMRGDDEDFGQTLGVWGVEQGNFIVLPFLGPSSTRDVFSYADSLYYNEYWPAKIHTERTAAITINLINIRASLLDLEKQIDTTDRYAFIRDAWLQRREFLVNDGLVVVDDFGAEAATAGDESEEGEFEDLDDEF